MSIRDELLALKDEDGLIVAEGAVEWAKANPTSALYLSLEWDNDKAAHEHRIWQVRRLISIHVVYDSGARQVVSLSIDRKQPGGGYRSIEDVLPNVDLRECMLADAVKELERVQLKYNHLHELADVWKAKDKVKRRAPRRQPAAVELRA